jgi:zinc resistance-associated protein
MRNTIIPLVAALLLVVAFANAQPASPPAGAPGAQPRGHAGMAPGMMGMNAKGPMSQMPKLTKDQRKQLFDLHVKFFNETAQLKFDISEKRMELDSLWNVDNPDASTILAKWGEIDSLEHGLRVKTVNFRLSVRKIVGKNSMGGMGMGMGMCPCMGGGMMGDNMMMPGMGGMGSGPQTIQIEKRVERPSAMPEGNE